MPLSLNVSYQTSSGVLHLTSVVVRDLIWKDGEFIECRDEMSFSVLVSIMRSNTEIAGS